MLSTRLSTESLYEILNSELYFKKYAKNYWMAEFSSVAELCRSKSEKDGTNFLK